MAFAFVRNYQRTSGPTTAAPSGTWSYAGNDVWNVRPELWPWISAFVVRRAYGPPTLLTTLAETAILTENTRWRPGETLSWNQGARSCSSHMSRFLTESLGLCVALESAADYGWQPTHAIYDADRLPIGSPIRVTGGSRPDFIIQTPSGWHGIEARGRHSNAPVRNQRPNSKQTEKLQGLHNWSARLASQGQVAGSPSWSMAWSWITDSETWIDHFDPGDPVELSQDDEQAIWAKMSDTAAKLSDVDDPRIESVRALGRSMSMASRRINDDSAGQSTWLTVASWTDRLSAAELQDSVGSRNLTTSEGSRPNLGDDERLAVGAFLATAITERPLSASEFAALVENNIR